MEAPYLSTRTIVEKCPDAAPNEVERIIEERGALVKDDNEKVKTTAVKANNISRNRSNEIVDNTGEGEVEEITIKE